MSQRLDRRNLVKCAAAAGAALPFLGWAGCGPPSPGGAAVAASAGAPSQGEPSMNTSDVGGAEAIAIRRLQTEIVDAANSLDLDRLMSHFHRDVVYLVPGRPPIVGWNAVRSYYDGIHTRYRGMGQYLYLKAITHEVVVMGDWAWVYGESYAVMSPLRQTPAIASDASPGSKHLGIYRRDHGEWLRYRQIRNGNTPEMNI